MALTPSTMVPLGTPAPDFNLPEPLAGETPKSLADVTGQHVTVIMFICNHCPFVQHVEDALIALAADYQAKGVGFVAINSNDVAAYPDDAPAKMAARAQEKRYPFPYLYDADQTVARNYDAACTPDFFVFDKQLTLAYRGQLDDSRPGNDVPVTGRDLRAALDALLAGGRPDPEQKPSVGCNIKWK